MEEKNLSKTNNPEEEIQEENQEDITEENSEAIREFMGDTSFEDDSDEVEEEPEEDEVEEEEPEEEVDTKTEKEEVDTIAPDKEEIIRETEKQVSEKIKDDILKTLGYSEKEQQEAEDKGYQTPWAKRGEAKPASWDEVLEASADMMEFRRIQKDNELKKRQEQENQEIEKQNKVLNDEWDSQLEFLRQQKIIPDLDPSIKQKLQEGKRLTKEERGDAGLVAQAEIFEKMYEISEDRAKQGLPPISDAVHIYTRYIAPNKQSKKPAGAKAFVSGGSKSVPQDDGEDIPYEKLSQMDLHDIVQV